MSKKYYFLFKSNRFFFPKHSEDLQNSMFILMDIVIVFFLSMINKYNSSEINCDVMNFLFLVLNDQFVTRKKKMKWDS